MKNGLYANSDESGKFAAFLYRYHEKPSGSIIPILLVSTEFAFDSAKEAADYVFERLKPECQANTEVSF